MKAQTVGKSVRIEHFKGDAAVMLIIIRQTEQIHHRWADIGVVREEISELGHADPSHAGANHTDESSGDLGLNVTVIPRETCANKQVGNLLDVKKKFGSPKKVKVGSRFESDAKLICRSF
jgi:hypothetical protein